MVEARRVVCSGAPAALSSRNPPPRNTSCSGNKRNLWLCLFALAVLNSSCANAKLHEKALAEWRRNEKIVEIAINGGWGTTDEYEDAVVFFHELTGINVHSDGTFFGLIPVRGSSQDLVRIKGWCKVHCKKIYWDESLKKVKLKEGWIG
jgi:hypothetical protein